MSVTLGESFTMSGRVAALRQADTTAVTLGTCVPNVKPPASTLGQLMLTS